MPDIVAINSLVMQENMLYYCMVNTSLRFEGNNILLPAWLRHRLNQSHPTTLLLLSYLAAILAGTLVLMLPPATVSGHISLINAFFTATSAVCVTGLIVVDTGSYFTLFGQG